MTADKLPWVVAVGLVLACGDDDDAGRAPDGGLQQDATLTRPDASTRPDAMPGRPDGPILPDAATTPPPTVVGSTPADGADGVPADTSVRIVFSQPIDAVASASAVTLTDADGGALELVSLAPPDPQTLLFRLASSPPRGAQLVLRVAEAVGTSGVVQAEPFVASFRIDRLGAVPPRLGTLEVAALDCTDAYELPAEIDGPDGLAAVGLSWDDLHSTVAWVAPNRGVMPWISDNSRTVASVRIDVERGPNVGQCYVRAVRTATSSGGAAVVRALSAFHDPSVGLDSLTESFYRAPDYDEEGLDRPLTTALRGLFEALTPVAGSPMVAWSEGLEDDVLAVEEALPPVLAAALADFVLAVGEAHLLRESALNGVPFEAWSSIAEEIVARNYVARPDLRVLEPEPLLDLTRTFSGTEQIDLFELADMSRAAQRVFGASETLADVADDVREFDGPGLDVLTPVGRFVVRPGPVDHKDAPDDAALILDLGGDDQYPGRVASTHRPYLVASVLIDVVGNDRYGPEGFDLKTASGGIAFSSQGAFTQGLGLLGVALLHDLSGDDTYRATLMSQGAGIMGVGALIDDRGVDSYHGTFFAQGTGQVGVGMLWDQAGDDAYVLGGHGQGVGRPRGLGTLIDGAGDDDYLALHDDDPPVLLEKYRVFFPSPYFDEGPPPEPGEEPVPEQHNQSVAQGVGWGFRFDWFTDETNWAGGFGSLLDFGSGRDVHFADAMSMGQGFVYGLGLLHDDGGDDIYRAFWWAFGSGTHMGTGMFMEGGGDDDLTIGQFSAGLGHDTGISWYIDRGGDDRYGGQMTYGRALDEGLSFFIEEGGMEIYEGINSTNHGICQHREPELLGLERVGLFIDLGGEVDAYLTGNVSAMNDASWYQSPRGGSPAFKRGIGLDR